MRNAVFFNFLAVLFFVGGPIMGFRMAMREPGKWRRWQVMMWSAAGGAVACDVFLGLLFVAGVLPTSPVRDVMRAALGDVGWYALFGLLLGFAGLVPRPAGMPRLVVTGLAMVGLMIVGRMALNVAIHRPPGPGPSGLVFGPDNRPAVGAPVFIDRGSGEIERLTTDASGVFRVARGRPGAQPPLLMICVPGAGPYVGRVDEYIITPEHYRVMALPPRASVEPGIRAFGWQQPIPRECLIGSAEQW